MSATAHQLWLRLAIEPGDGLISGRLIDRDGHERAFAGWLGLLAALEEALARHPPPSG